MSLTAMPQVFGSLGTRVYYVSFFGMKWRIVDAEFVLDRFIAWHQAYMGSSVLMQRNMFDYGI